MSTLSHIFRKKLLSLDPFMQNFELKRIILSSVNYIHEAIGCKHTSSPLPSRRILAGASGKAPEGRRAFVLPQERAAREMAEYKGKGAAGGDDSGAEAGGDNAGGDDEDDAIPVDSD